MRESSQQQLSGLLLLSLRYEWSRECQQLKDNSPIATTKIPETGEEKWNKIASLLTAPGHGQRAKMTLTTCSVFWRNLSRHWFCFFFSPRTAGFSLALARPFGHWMPILLCFCFHLNRIDLHTAKEIKDSRIVRVVSEDMSQWRGAQRQGPPRHVRT